MPAGRAPPYAPRHTPASRRYGVPAGVGPSTLPRDTHPSAASRGHVLNLDTDARELVVTGFQAPADPVMQATAGVRRRALVERTDTIVEGVHLVPGAHDLPDELEATTSFLPSSREIRRTHHEVVRRAQDHGVPQVSSTTPQQTARDAFAVVAERTR